MTPNITVVDTEPFHLRMMSDAMNPNTAEVARRWGLTPLKALWTSYRQSIICKSLFIDGKLAAIYGISGTIFSDTGKPWLCMTPETEEYPMRVAFRFRAELNKMLEMFPILEDYVHETDEKAMRMLELMGFKISKNQLTIGEMVMRRAERRK